MLAVSSPPASHLAGVMVPAGTDAEEIADSLAILAAALATRLVAGAAMATCRVTEQPAGVLGGRGAAPPIPRVAARGSG